ncbi:MAG: polyphenol oxidase family protein [Actinomycetaceae bacterium]|nr:polyphenol oxidase family protein [Actinomycetaceae bacterium]
MTLETMHLGPARIGFTRSQPHPAGAYQRPNFGLATGDEISAVQQDRKDLSQRVGKPLIWLEQYHSRQVEVLTGKELTQTTLRTDIEQGRNALRADALIVSAQVGVAIQVADCVPVLIAEESGHWRCGIHAGRAGLEAGIIGATVERFQGLGVGPHQLQAAVGPHICGRCYEVDETTYARCVSKHPVMAGKTSWGTLALDQTRAALKQLQEAGVKVAVKDLACTYETPNLHSYRRQGNTSGRNAAWIIP